MPPQQQAPWRWKAQKNQLQHLAEASRNLAYELKSWAQELKKQLKE
jgi:hypothetical protein